MPAHPQIADIIEEDDACGRSRRDRGREQRADYRLMSPGLAHHGLPQVIPAAPQIVPPFGHCRTRRRSPEGIFSFASYTRSYTAGRMAHDTVGH